MKWCVKCVGPLSAVNLSVDSQGVCAACRLAEKLAGTTSSEWEAKQSELQGLFKELPESANGYDCVIPVSGGKDSYFQTHIVVKKFGLKPLLVTYHGNNFLPEADQNRDRMRHVFDCDHIVWGPSVEVIKKLNRVCFQKMGDMNWHNHCGIVTAPIIVAARFRIPLVIWGELPWDVSGMYDPQDMVEFTARMRKEHDLRGYEWDALLGPECESLGARDFQWAMYPTDDQILQAGVRGIYIGNYFPWDPNDHAKLMEVHYGWKKSEKPFERTYRLISNLDDRYENGVHDLLKFIKFGYGRGTDHASKDIRLGYMTRDEGVEMVRKYDHVVSNDLFHWLDYVQLTEDEFWETADKFRDPRVWWIKDNQWWKHDLWGGMSAYGEVRLTPRQVKEFVTRSERLKLTPNV